MERDPLKARAPDQAPAASQDVAYAEDQVNTAAWPLATVVGLALIVAVGVFGVTETTADCVALPPGPTQVKVKVAVASSAAVSSFPVAALSPVQAPDAVQELDAVALQVSVVDSPAVSELGLALKLMAGADAATLMVVDCAALPPDPVQVSVNSVLLVSACVVRVPLVGNEPLQPPPAVHAVLFVALQVNTEVAPVKTVVGVAFKVTDGSTSVATTSADCDSEPPGPVQVSE